MWTPYLSARSTSLLFTHKLHQSCLVPITPYPKEYIHLRAETSSSIDLLIKIHFMDQNVISPKQTNRHFTIKRKPNLILKKAWERVELIWSDLY